MKQNRKGFILPISEATHTIIPEGNTNIEFYGFLRTETENVPPGTEPSMHLMFNMDKVGPGGEIEEHYHEPPVVDHVYYVISGRVRAKVGDIEKIVGADTLIYCPSNIKHSVINIGKGVAKVIAIDASGEGERGGKVVYSKMPSGDLSANTWKVAGT